MSKYSIIGELANQKIILTLLSDTLLGKSIIRYTFYVNLTMLILGLYLALNRAYSYGENWASVDTPETSALVSLTPLTTTAIMRNRPT